jgi:hypothetical protein
MPPGRGLDDVLEDFWPSSPACCSGRRATPRCDELLRVAEAKTDAIDAVAAARVLLAEPTLGPVQTLEIYGPLVAKIAALKHRRALVEAETLLCTTPPTSWRSSRKDRN